jgi:outer membrane lipoprotein SlyB
MRHPNKTLGIGLVFIASLYLAACGADPDAESAMTDEDEAEQQAATEIEPAPAPAPQAPAAKPDTDFASNEAPVCADCGTISSIEKKTEEGEGSGAGAVTGAVLGGVAGREIVHGDRDKRNIAGVVGAIAGGYAGHKIEEKARSKTYYRVSVRMEDDRTETVTLNSAEGLSVGQKVRVQDGNIVIQ